MPKIKVEKQMNLEELIKYAKETSLKRRVFKCRHKNGEVVFDTEGKFCSHGWISEDDTFTVEDEIEVTENTILPYLVQVVEEETIKPRKHIYQHRYASINEIIQKETPVLTKILSFRILKVDGTMILLWRNGEMVE